MLSRIGALVARNLTLTFRGIDPLIDVFYWPLFDLVLWGFTSKVVQYGDNSKLSLIWLAGLVLWQACWRSNLDICFNLLSELWSRNVANLFASPLQLSEWICASMIVGSIDAIITIFYGALVVYLLYGISIFSVGWLLVPAIVLLLMSGWSIGFFAAGWIIYSGQKVQKVVWVLGWMFVPFSAIFIPLSVLPPAALVVARILPMTYVYEGLRAYVTCGIVPVTCFMISLALNLFYLMLSLLFFEIMFNKSKSKGLARLDAE